MRSYKFKDENKDIKAEKTYNYPSVNKDNTESKSKLKQVLD